MMDYMDWVNMQYGLEDSPTQERILEVIFALIKAEKSRELARDDGE